jgi:hypothetical protein
MAKKFLTHIDLSGNQLIKASFEKLSTDPGTNLFSGRMYYNTVSKAIKIYDGSTWVGIGEIVSIEGTTNEVTVSVVDGVATIGLPTNIHVNVTGDLTGNASSATNADYATNAGSASYADTAGSATNADYATSAGSATNADYATSAGSATNADYATSAGNATTADSATTAGTASAVSPNSVTLGSDTVGDYVSGVSAGTGISVSGSGGEGSTVTVTNDDKGSDQSIFKTVYSDSGDFSASTNSDSFSILGGTGISTSASGTTLTVDNDGVTEISGTVDQIAVDVSTGSVTLSLPSAVTFPGTVTLNADPSADLQAATKQYVDAKVNGLTWKQAANVIAASNVPLTGSTPLSVDSHTLDDGYRVVLTNQTTDTENGIYNLSISSGSYTLTRSADADTYTELIGASIFIEEGTLYGKTSWVQANHYITSFAGQDWYQVSGQGTYTAGDGLSLIGGEFAVKTATSGGLMFNGSGELEVDGYYVTTNSGTQTLYDKTLYTPKILGPVYVQSGGGAGGLNNTITANNSTAVLEIGSGYGVAINATGDVIITPTGSAKIGSDVITTNTASQTLTNKTIASPVITGDGVVFEGATVNTYQTTLAVTDPTADRTITLPNATGTVALTSDLTGLTHKLSANVGNGSNTSFALSHNLGTRDVQVQVFDNGTYDTVECDVVRTDVDTVTVSFAVAPTSNAYRVVIVG